MLSRYTPKLDGSKISNLPIDRVYPIYVHYGKFKGKPTYPDAINPYLRDTQAFHAYVLTNSHSPFMWGLLGLARCEWEIKKRKWKVEEPMKMGEPILEGK